MLSAHLLAAVAPDRPPQPRSRAAAALEPSDAGRPGAERSGEAFRAVLVAARSGSEWAWASLYRDLAPRVLAYLRARGAVEPEDVAGEVFLQAVRDIGRFEGDERAFRAWLLTIAHHRLLDASRHRARRPVDAVSDEVLHDRGPTGDVEDDAFRELDMATVRGLVARLSPDQQSVLLLRIVGDLTVEEVARVVGKRRGAVKALQRRGLAALELELSSD
ncbi:MAG: sigma-70 family RNA polymerase sigma factor [Thermoleophilaceae bacterium]|nr:sigma-70 family RNA polymerase sigma factor [Thermoleophilaceae bacterium]